MKPSASDLEWLTQCYPGLLYDANDNDIVGELVFCAGYDSRIGRVRIGDDDAHRQLASFLCDSYSLRIDLNSIDTNGWPRVYETGGRHQILSNKHDVDTIDLHFYPDGTCCLGIRFPPERFLTMELFIDELVVPFLFRLSYVDKNGPLAARDDLWGEYAHGDDGIRQYMSEIMDMVSRDPGRNELCPCGSGRKFKRCHLDDVEALKSGLARRRRSSGYEHPHA